MQESSIHRHPLQGHAVLCCACRSTLQPPTVLGDAALLPYLLTARQGCCAEVSRAPQEDALTCTCGAGQRQVGCQRAKMHRIRFVFDIFENVFNFQKKFSLTWQAVAPIAVDSPLPVKLSLQCLRATFAKYVFAAHTCTCNHFRSLQQAPVCGLLCRHMYCPLIG
jgi:hypothetical protein